MYRDKLKSHFIHIIGVGFISFLLNGCGLWGKNGYIRDYSVDYIHVRETPKVPFSEYSDIGAETSSSMVIPDIKGKIVQPTTANQIPSPAHIMLHSSLYHYRVLPSEAFVIETNARDTLLWKRMISYFKTNSIAIMHSDMQEKVIETDWFVPAHQREYGFLFKSYQHLFAKEDTETGEKQEVKLYYRITQYQENLWHIEVKFKKNVIGQPHSEVWHTENPSPIIMAQNQDILVYLVEHEGDQIESQKGRLKKLDEKDIISLKDGNGIPVLHIDTNFNNAWNYVSNALKKLNIVVEKADKAAGIFYIQLPDSTTIDWNKPKPNDAQSFKQLQKSFAEHTGGDVKSSIYRLVLAPVKEGIYVSLEKDINQIAPIPLSSILIEEIQKAL